MSVPESRSLTATAIEQRTVKTTSGPMRLERPEDP